MLNCTNSPFNLNACPDTEALRCHDDPVRIYHAISMLNSSLMGPAQVVKGLDHSQAALTCWIFWFGLNVCWLAILLSVWYPSSTVPITTCTPTDTSYGSPCSAIPPTETRQRRKASAGSQITQETDGRVTSARSVHQAMAPDQDLQGSRSQHNLEDSEHAGKAGPLRQCKPDGLSGDSQPISYTLWECCAMLTEEGL